MCSGASLFGTDDFSFISSPEYWSRDPSLSSHDLSCDPLWEHCKMYFSGGSIGKYMTLHFGCMRLTRSFGREGGEGAMLRKAFILPRKEDMLK